MKRWCKIFYIFTIVFLIVACNKKEFSEHQNPVPNIKDSKKLQWSNKSVEKITWDEVFGEKNYCSTLNEGGYHDWKVPNFEEIRTLIINCPNMEYGGDCKYKSVAIDCGRYCDEGDEDLNKCMEENCISTINCEPCPKGNHSKMGDKEALWFFKDANGDSDFRNATTLDFNTGEIFESRGMPGENEKFRIRCVRNPS